MEKFENGNDFRIIEKHSLDIKTVEEKEHRHQTKLKAIEMIGAFVMNHCAGSLNIINDVDRIYMYAHDKENPKDTYRIIIYCDDI